jgi:DNA helicase-2/ATP-dependent DNA helicase PcrA
LDFSTSQTEFLRRLETDGGHLQAVAEQRIHVVVDEVQDINPVQRDIIRTLAGETGKLTAVGDHRQSIYGFRGAKVEIIGQMWNEFIEAADSEVIDLQKNFRSTPRIIHTANRWARTIKPAAGMSTPDMHHGKVDRLDTHRSHVALVEFQERGQEAAWIAQAIRAIVPSPAEGAEHDRRDGSIRGIALSDIAVLVRSSTDVRTYMRALEDMGVPSIVRAGPDLFSQPEVLFFVGALAISAGIDAFYGSPHDPRSLPHRIADVLRCPPEPEQVLRASARVLRDSGLPVSDEAEDRVLFASRALRERIAGRCVSTLGDTSSLRSGKLHAFLTSGGPPRRVFPQRLYHWLLTEGEVEKWDRCSGHGETAMFHLGALSGLITGIETPGWTSTSDYKWQIIGLCHYGSEGGRTPEQPLIVQPDAVTISTIHGAKGLEFAAVFVADVCARRFPSQRARQKVRVPLSGDIVYEIDIDGLSDNDNYDGERRLMYVALTRAERFMVISCSRKKETSLFIKGLREIVAECGGTVTTDSAALLRDIRHAALEHETEIQLATSFSDLRYYLACPHDFYLRKVLGFAPPIDQAFGYGRGVHNLMRAIHSDPRQWAALARDRSALEAELERLVERGLFYLRYTTGDPAENMRRKGIRIAADYVQHFAEELRDLTFEPEKRFETFVEYEDGQGGALISGTVDIVRHDDPPQVTLIDFKSGDSDTDNHQKLDDEEMRLQIAVYAVAAKKELEYEPETGLVRYLDVDRSAGDKHELEVPLDQGSVEDARRVVKRTATAIRRRQFLSNPHKPGRNGEPRCGSCDYLGFCGMQMAVDIKRDDSGHL